MRASMSIVAAAVVAVLGVSVSTQQRVSRDERLRLRRGAELVVAVPTAGYAWGSVPGIFVESDDRIFIASRGEIRSPSPLPAEYKGSSVDSGRRSTRPKTKCAAACASWTATARCSRSGRSGTGCSRAPTVRTRSRSAPTIPQHRVSGSSAETKNVIYVFSNDGKQLLQTLGVEGVTAEDETHFGRPQDLAFLPDGSVLVADGLTTRASSSSIETGKFVTSWGGHGSGDGQFNAVHGIDVDRNGRVYVVDRTTSACRCSTQLESTWRTGRTSASRITCR